jgi:hypothetical protein
MSRRYGGNFGESFTGRAGISGKMAFGTEREQGGNCPAPKGDKLI